MLLFSTTTTKKLDPHQVHAIDKVGFQKQTGHTASRDYLKATHDVEKMDKRITKLGKDLQCER